MNTDFKKIFARNLEEILRRKGLSQKALAEIAGIWPQQISSWIKERDKISTQNLYKVAAALEVGVEELTKEIGGSPVYETPSQAELFNASLTALNRIEQKLDACKEMLERDDSDSSLYQVLFQKLPCGVGLAELNGNVVASNDKMCELMRYTKEEIVGVNAEKFYKKPEMRKQLFQILEKEGSVDHFETELLRGDGSVIWANFTTKVVVIRGKKYVITLLEDVTEIKKVLNKLPQKDKKGEIE